MPRWLTLLFLPLLALAAGAYYWLFQRPASTPIIGRPAPAFELQTLDGSNTSLAAYRGHPAIVNFWATWCEPCKKEMPALQAASAAHPELVVLGVDNVESAVKVKPFVDQLGVRFPILLDQDGSVMERYQVTGLPTSFFIDRSGALRSLYRGALTPDTLRSSVAAISG
ncbi:MAG TPA: TlpA disulfide reductase family protein [Chloroflexota bacterium]|nr:TlpA disulfide reductase family protein [Chloroflexota bacterium]